MDADRPKPAAPDVVADAGTPRRLRRRRSRRQRGLARAITIPNKTSDARALQRLLVRDAVANDEIAENSSGRPTTRAQCRGGARPCPWVTCKHHLYLDVNPQTGSIKLNFPDLEPWELAATCSLDEADRGGLTLEEIAERTNLTRERVRQVEMRGFFNLRARVIDLGGDAPDLASFSKPREAVLPSMGSGSWWTSADEGVDEDPGVG